MESDVSNHSHHRASVAIGPLRSDGFLTAPISRLYSALVDLGDNLKQALERLLGSGPVKVEEDGAWIAPLENFQYDVRKKSGAVLLHLWSAEATLVRHVTALLEDGDGRLALKVTRFGRTRASRLEFTKSEREPEYGRLRREQFRSRLMEMLAHQFPDEALSSVTSAADLEHSISGSYIRGTSTGNHPSMAIMAAAPGENAATYDGLLTFGLLWLERSRHLKLRKPIAGLRLFFPQGTGRISAHRLRAFSVEVELYEYDAASWRARRLDPQDVGNIQSWLVPRREYEALLSAARNDIESIRRMNPAAITAEPIPATRDAGLRFRGLLFARCGPGGIFFGVDSEQALNAATRPELQRLVHDLGLHRSPFAAARHHSFYRAQPERWLESMVLADPSRIDPRLDSRFIYAQVPAVSSGDRGIIDLLGVSREGRLTVIELKANEDVHIVTQAIDYWLRVRQHQVQGDFARYGYFPGINLSSHPPLVILVAPSLRFHPTGDILARFLAPELQISRVGLNENWRRGLRVVLRQSLR